MLDFQVKLLKHLEINIDDFPNPHQAFFFFHWSKMADHVVCVKVRVKNTSGNADNLASGHIGRFSTKLSLADICNKLVGECELDPSVNNALDHQQVKVQLSSKDSPTDTFEIEYIVGSLTKPRNCTFFKKSFFHMARFKTFKFSL